VRAVNGIDLEVGAGEFVTLLGPSGCGKTTTLRIVAGLEQATEGRVELFDEVVVDTASGIEIPPNKRPIGMVFQSYALWPHMTALANVAFPLQNRDTALGRRRNDRSLRPSSEIHALAMEALERVQCAHLSNRYPGEMSGGQQQRVALARSIVHSPPLVLLDEPLSNLDAKLRRDLRVELRRLQEDIGFAALYVTHDQAEALAMSDRVVLMKDGTIEQVATPRRLFEWPGTPYAAGFIGDHNLLTGRIESEANDGAVIVATPIGAIIARPARDGVRARVGAQGIVALRTDRIRMEAAGSMDPNTGARLPHALVLGSAYNGAYVDILFEVGGQQLSVRDYSGAEPPMRGATVSLLAHTEAVLAEVLEHDDPS
jgi:iron(III) transport system ATP-binding protein